MECPICHADNDYTQVSVEPSADEGGLEVGFTCCSCGQYFYVVLQPEVFEEVD